MTSMSYIEFISYHNERVNNDNYFDMLLLLRQYQRNMKKKKDIRYIDDIPRMQRELMSKDALEKAKNVGISQEIIDLEKKYKLKELKELVLKNHILKEDVIGNKGHKRTWSKALYKSTKWGFNAFVVGVNKEKGHLLRGQIDVLLMIQDKL